VTNAWRSRVCAFVTAARWLLPSGIGSVAPARGFTHAVSRIDYRFPPPMPDRSAFITYVVHRIAGYGYRRVPLRPAGSRSRERGIQRTPEKAR